MTEVSFWSVAKERKAGGSKPRVFGQPNDYRRASPLKVSDFSLSTLIAALIFIRRRQHSKIISLLLETRFQTPTRLHFPPALVRLVCLPTTSIFRMIAWFTS